MLDIYSWEMGSVCTIEQIRLKPTEITVHTGFWLAF